MTTPLETSYREIPLTKGQIALVDAVDLHLISGRKWQATEVSPGKFYATRKDYVNGKQIMIYMHRHLLGLGQGDARMGEHANLNGLDNRRSNNLRIATKSQNMMNCGLRSDNLSGFKNVFWDKRSRRWWSYGTANGIRVFFGSFLVKEDAIRAVRERLPELHGKFVRFE